MASSSPWALKFLDHPNCCAPKLNRPPAQSHPLKTKTGIKRWINVSSKFFHCFGERV